MNKVIVGVVIGFVFSHTLNAEVVFDDSFSTNNAGSLALVESEYSITEDRGSLRGGNLFYSFSEFNIEAGNTAIFLGTTGIDNIISRVTGGNASMINGAVVSEIPSANLWLINASGVVFGDSSSVDVQGSFFISTADYIAFEGGGRFYAEQQENNILVTSPPRAFGFLSEAFPTNAKIEINNSRIVVPENNNIAVIGSQISLSGASLSAKGGNISVVSINEAGEVIYSDQGADISSIDSLGSLVINTTSFEINGSQEGRLQLEGGDLSFRSSDTNFISSVSQLKTSFPDNTQLMDKPCEIADYYQQGKMSFTVKQADEKEYGLKVKANAQGALGVIPAVECL